MDPNAIWLGWPLWGFAATAAQILSLVAIVFAAHELISGARRVQGSVFVVHGWAVVHDDSLRRPGYVVDIMNVGGAPALLTSLYLINATVILDPEFRVKHWLAPGDTMTLKLDSDDPTTVWFRFQWVSPSDRRYVSASWQVLQQGTELHSKWKAAYDKGRNARWPWTLIEEFRPKVVGPGGVQAARIRYARSIEGSSKRVLRALPMPEGSITNWNLGQVRFSEDPSTPSG